MEENVKEFVAFSKKLLRALKKVRDALDANNIELAKELLDEIIEDTQGDIEA